MNFKRGDKAGMWSVKDQKYVQVFIYDIEIWDGRPWITAFQYENGVGIRHSNFMECFRPNKTEGDEY
jgi:hypothetical protein